MTNDYITSESPAMLAIATVSEVVGQKFVGSTGELPRGFDATIAATILEETYSEFFERTSEAFANASPSELSRIALEALSETSEELGLDRVNSAGIANHAIKGSNSAELS